MGTDSWLLLGRLKRAVKKITFLLNINVNRFRIASMITGRADKRRVSFNDRPGLSACTEDLELLDSPAAGSSRGGGISRTTSLQSSEDDIDKRAEMFIANFYRQLRLERQVSLQLRYCREDSFDSASPTPR
ncbi:uncharacterized protein LOC131322680 [Rhododendron vialii]|uniref:uncharacterized protein LOC131322680 n=1 Tax=Rhododendron vialii TaxID=182163 RepID=UPI00266017D0|nr:uncharacterized protein LOC131322680 [Rhododendron vialii]